MSLTTLELKLNRSLLNPDFDGYKLSLTDIPVSRKDLENPVKNILLHSSQYSKLHVNLFGYHNHLIADRYDGFNSVYFIDQNLDIQKTYIDTLTNELVSLVTVYNIPKLREHRTGDYDVSLKFASPQFAVLSDGMGTMYILDTRDKKDDDFFESLFSGKVLDNEEQGFVIVDALYSEDNKELHVLLLNIEEDSLERFITIVHWITFKELQSDSSDNEAAWAQTALRRLRVSGEVHYLYLETNCEHIYIASDGKVSFELNSEHPIQSDTNLKSAAPATIYKWSQNFEGITVRVNLPQNAEKNLIQVATESNTIEIKYETKTVLSGELWNKIDSSLTTWTLNNNVLELTLSKEEDSALWPEFIKGNKQGEYVVDSSIIDQVNDRLGRLTTDTEAASQAGITLNSEQAEECDFETDKDTTFQRISGTTNKATHIIYLGSVDVTLKQYLTSDTSPAFGIKNDVDLCLWQPHLEGPDFTVKHEGTLLAYSYVVASKPSRKFMTCSADLEYSVVAEFSNHIFIYRQNKPLLSTELRHRGTGTRVKNIAQQQVFNLPNQTILGICANNKYLFVLGEDFIMSLNINL